MKNWKSCVLLAAAAMGMSVSRQELAVLRQALR